MDIVRNKDFELELENRQEMGQCNRECETIRSVCDDITGPMGEDIAEYLFEKRDDVDESTLLEFMCSSVCVNDGIRPRVPRKLAKKHKIGEEEWVAMTDEEKEKRIGIFQEIMDENKRKKVDL